jgi:hypothetical protein
MCAIPKLAFYVSITLLPGKVLLACLVAKSSAPEEFLAPEEFSAPKELSAPEG